MSVVREIEGMKTEQDKPIKDVIIKDCGEISRDDLKSSACLIENDGTEDIYPQNPDDLDDVDWFLQARSPCPAYTM